MACCVLAAFILAQCVATVRRWGMFWGLIAIPEGESARTLFGVIRTYLVSPKGRLLVSAVIAAEIVALGGWTYVHHGQHLLRMADIAWGRLQGRQVMYVARCEPNGRSTTLDRLVVDSLN